jgi:NAD(P)-dependent dehydrogenase (short-subunit alcohol dehydrogenase family)
MISAELDELFSVEGKVALITGGGRGIGKETASVLSKASASVAILDRDEDSANTAVETVTAAGGNALAIVADVAKTEEIDRCVSLVADHFGRVDILVTNAALVRRVPAFETSIEMWKEVLDVNLTAAFCFSCEAAKRMPSSGGVIVNIASIMGLSGGGIYPIASYHATKGGLVNLTRALAVEWAPRHIRVNAVAPTWVRTELTKSLLDDPEMSRALLELMPLRRFANTIDVAAAVLYLASPAAALVTGHVLAVDGGFLAR